MNKKLSEDIIEFLIDHPMAQSVVRNIMHKSVTTEDDPKQMAKLCPICDGFNGEHGKMKSAYLIDCPRKTK